MPRGFGIISDDVIMFTMTELRSVRDGWADIEKKETGMLRALTLEQGIQQFLALQREFEPLLRQTETFFRAPRNQALSQLQTRLRTLNNLMTQRTDGNPMEHLVRSVAALQQRFAEAGVPSAVIGGLAVSAWGEPRLTRDADLKVLARRDEREHILELLADLTPLHADPDEALRRQGLAFFQDAEGTRIDVMLAETSFDEAAIGRARTVEIQPGLAVRVCSAEDLIVYKLVSTRMRDHLDVEGIVRRQGAALDDRYVEQWLHQFEVALDDSTLLAEYRRLQQRFAA